MEPTPPAAAETATTSPSLRIDRAHCGVGRAAGDVQGAPTSQLSSRGLRISWSTGTATCVAWLERVHEKPSTSSPTPKVSTPTPIR